MKPPEIDTRDFEQIVEDIRARAAYYVPELDRDKGAEVALIKIVANMLKVVIDRLNRVPAKNFAAFLDMLGIQLLPAQPSRAPVTFYLSEGAKESVLIPERSQTSAAELVFETEKNMVATPSNLVKAYSISVDKDEIFASPPHIVKGEAAFPFSSSLLFTAAEGDRKLVLRDVSGLEKGDILKIGSTEGIDYGEVSDVSDTKVRIRDKLLHTHGVGTSVENVTKLELLEGLNRQEHILYLGHEDLFTIKGEATIKIDVTDSASASHLGDSNIVQWEYWGEAIGTEDAKESKEVDWHPLTIEVSNASLSLQKTGWTDTKGQTWKSGELKECEINGVKSSRWIRCKATDIAKTKDVVLDSIQIGVAVTQGIRPDMAFYNDAPLDLTTGDRREFKTPIYPFGKIPRLYDTFYIASQECFSKKGEVIQLEFFLEEKGEPQADLILSWEYWNGKGWQAIEGIKAFTFQEDGDVSFTCPHDFQTTEINGQKNYWVRVRILNGGYGKEEVKQFEEEGDKIWRCITAVKPPEVKALKITIKEPEKWNLQYCLTCNNLAFNDVTEESKTKERPFKPFQPLADTHQTLYLGFDGKIEKGLSIFFSLEDQEVLVAGMPKIEWLYYSRDKKWVRLDVLDNTQNLTRTGAVEFIVPADVAKTSACGDERYWIKAVVMEDTFRPPSAAKVKGIYLNTTFAIQAERIKDELLGSGDGSANQQFQFTRKPVIKEELWVNETGTLLEEEKRTIKEEKGEDYVFERNDETWIRWQAVEDFFDSTSTSRHYVVDRAIGEVKFGDGERGMVPPIGRDNIKATYQVGGGESGNVEASAISTLKTSIPFVDSVTNPEAAEGGSDTELLESVFERGPYLIKHRDRAVTEEDFERLARAASSYIARTRCFTAGNRVKIVIIPKGEEDKPMPSPGLMKRVENYLRERSLNVIFPARIAVQEPTYKEVKITVDVIPESIEQAIPLEKEIVKRLKEFLHPLTGGSKKSGWEFGRNVHISDVYALLEGINGVEHVKELTLNGESKDVKVKEDETVCSGEHRIRMRLEVT